MRKPIVLIVDDILDNITFLEIMLAKKGFETVVARDGRSALNYLIDKEADVILLDIMMPELDGLEVCRIIKSEEKTKHIPVIFLTSKNESEDIVKGFQAGGDDYIIKPFNLSELIARVTTNVNLKRTQDINKQLIEELTQKNAELQDKEQKLIELNATKDKFFSIIAHDLKNPFQGLLGITDLLTNHNNMLEESERQALLSQISNSTNNLYKLLDNLLIWSRIQMGKLKKVDSEFSLNELIDEIFELFNNQAKEKNIELESVVDSDFKVIYDKNILNTVIRNLISNAIKFTGLNGKVKINADNNDDKITICVEDNGIGIKKENQEKLFKLDSNFYTQGTNREEGSGIGLKICKELLEKNAGSLDFESQENQGTKFIIRF